MNHIEHAIDEIERVLNGNKSRDVEEAYLQNAIRSLKTAGYNKLLLARRSARFAHLLERKPGYRL